MGLGGREGRVRGGETGTGEGGVGERDGVGLGWERGTGGVGGREGLVRGLGERDGWGWGWPVDRRQNNRMLRQCPSGTAQRPPRHTIAVPTAMQNRVTKTRFVAPPLGNN